MARRNTELPAAARLALAELTAEVGRHRQLLAYELQRRPTHQHRATDAYDEQELRRLDEVIKLGVDVLGRERRAGPGDPHRPDLLHTAYALRSRKRTTVVAAVVAAVLVVAAVGLLARAWADLPVVQLDASTGACVGVVVPEGEDQWSCDRLPPKFVTRWVLR